MSESLAAYKEVVVSGYGYARRLRPLAELITNAVEVRKSRPRPMPLEKTVTMHNGDVLRYWSDGSLRYDKDDNP